MSGTGWHEFVSADKATTHIAYVYENGSVYFPEGPSVVGEDDFTFAAARGRVYRLVRADDAEDAAEDHRRRSAARVAELEAQLERADDPCPHDPVGYVHAGSRSVHSCAACRVRVEGWVQWRTGERATFTEFPKEAGR